MTTAKTVTTETIVTTVAAVTSVTTVTTATTATTAKTLTTVTTATTVTTEVIVATATTVAAVKLSLKDYILIVFKCLESCFFFLALEAIIIAPVNCKTLFMRESSVTWE